MKFLIKVVFLGRKFKEKKIAYKKCSDTEAISRLVYDMPQM